jgi:hypothetical protein
MPYIPDDEPDPTGLGIVGIGRVFEEPTTNFGFTLDGLCTHTLLPKRNCFFC